MDWSIEPLALTQSGAVFEPPPPFQHLHPHLKPSISETLLQGKIYGARKRARAMFHIHTLPEQTHHQPRGDVCPACCLCIKYPGSSPKEVPQVDRNGHPGVVSPHTMTRESVSQM